MMKLNRRSFLSGSLALGTAVFAGESHAFPGTHVDQDTENLESGMVNPAYFDQFPHLVIGRFGNGVVLARLHTKEEEFMLTLDAYDELREAFTKISLDPANKALVLTGTGTHFIKGVDMQTFDDLHRSLPPKCIYLEAPRINSRSSSADISTGLQQKGRIAQLHAPRASGIRASR